MTLHIAIYMGLAAAYFEAAVHSFAGRRWHSACRELFITLLYASIAGLMMLDPAFLPVQSAALLA